jgi:hypothetical protein
MELRQDLPQLAASTLRRPDLRLRRLATLHRAVVVAAEPRMPAVGAAEVEAGVRTTDALSFSLLK